MSHKDLSDEDKIIEAINFVALGQPLPEPIERFLKEAGLYESIVNPGKKA